MYQVLFGVMVGVIIIMVGLVLASIDWGAYFERRFAPDPDKGLVELVFGSRVLRFKAKRTYNGDDGEVYDYRKRGERETVTVPKGYPHEYIRERRRIRVNDGSELACPFGDYVMVGGVDIVTSTNNGMVAVAAVKSITDTMKPLPWTLIIIGVVALVVVYFAYKYLTGEQSPPVVPPIEPGGNEFLPSTLLRMVIYG